MAKPQPNWLSSVDLGTYKFTLYVTNTQIWNEPEILVNDSNALRTGQAVVIAESGVTGGYGIDNVMFQSAIAGNLLTGSIATGVVQFDLHEPLAFKLLDRVLTFANLLGFSTMQSALYVLKLELQGKDITTGGPTKFPGVFFYPLMIQQITANVTVKGTQYNVIASNTPDIAQRESVIKTAVTVNEVATMEDFRVNLESTLNEVYTPNLTKKSADDQTKSNDPRVVYKVTFDESFLKAAPGNSPWKGLEAPDKSAGLSVDINNVDARVVTFQPESNLIIEIQDRITKNSPAFAEYSKRLRESENKTPVVVMDTKVTLQNKKDNDTNEIIKEIELIVKVDTTDTQPPATPQEHKELLEDRRKQEQMFNNRNIVKKYAYLYSGENTELLDFNINFDMLFNVAKLPASGKLYPDASSQAIGANIDKGTSNQTSGQAVTSGDQLRLGSGSRYSPYIEDTEVQSGVMIERVNYYYDTVSAARMQVTDTTNTGESIDVIMNREWYMRMGNSIEVEITIKGDPFWLGTPGSFFGKLDSGITANLNIDTGVNLSEYKHKGDVNVALTNYNPPEDIAQPGIQFEREMDMISSGVYRAYKLETRFQNGEFTHKIHMSRDQNISTFYTAELLDKL